jgi:hypothetical protein
LSPCIHTYIHTLNQIGIDGDWNKGSVQFVKYIVLGEDGHRLFDDCIENEDYEDLGNIDIVIVMYGYVYISNNTCLYVPIYIHAYIHIHTHV